MASTTPATTSATSSISTFITSHRRALLLTAAVAASAAGAYYLTSSSPSSSSGGGIDGEKKKKKKSKKSKGTGAAAKGDAAGQTSESEKSIAGEKDVDADAGELSTLHGSAELFGGVSEGPRWSATAPGLRSRSELPRRGNRRMNGRFRLALLAAG